MLEADQLCMCASGQWKMKFESKPKKGLFLKLDGDLVKVPLLYHQNYMMVKTYIIELRAQVMNSKHTSLTQTITLHGRGF